MSFTAGQQAVRDAAARALPVSLISWEAKSKATGTELTWSTAAEIENDYFLIERSSDGESFSEVARVTGKGNTESVVHYNYTDATAASGTNFYRLSQFDYDGTRTTYDVLSVNVNAAAQSVPYPNPARAGERVSFLAPAAATEVVLHSITGREVGRYPVTGGIDLPADLPAGIYLLRAGKVTTRLLVRQ